MGRRLYKLNPEDMKYHWFGHQLRMSGVLYQGENESYLLLLPTGFDTKEFNVVELSYGQWASVIEATDQPRYEDRVLKILRKKQEAAISGGTQWAIWERDGFRCMLCGKPGGKGVPLTIDHWIPLEEGGINQESNYISACRRCNKKKGSLMPEVYCEREGLDYTGLSKYLEGNFPSSFISHLT